MGAGKVGGRRFRRSRGRYVRVKGNSLRSRAVGSSRAFVGSTRGSTTGKQQRPLFFFFFFFFFFFCTSGLGGEEVQELCACESVGGGRWIWGGVVRVVGNGAAAVWTYERTNGLTATSDARILGTVAMHTEERNGNCAIAVQARSWVAVEFRELCGCGCERPAGFLFWGGGRKGEAASVGSHAESAPIYPQRARLRREIAELAPRASTMRCKQRTQRAASRRRTGVAAAERLRLTLLAHAAMLPGSLHRSCACLDRSSCAGRKRLSGGDAAGDGKGRSWHCGRL